MSDTAEVIFDAPVKKAKAKKASTKKPQAVPKSTSAFPGLTRTVCADGCGIKGCVISGKAYCAHPTKGGLQAADMNDPAALKRLQNARAQLDVRLDPDRFK